MRGAGSKPPAAPSLKIFLSLPHRPSDVLVSSAFGFFGICGGRARRAASSHAASDCATDTARRAAPHGRVGVRARTAILAFGARDWPLAPSASAAAARGARRRAAPRRAARRARHVELRRAVASAWLLAYATNCCVLACARRFWLLARAAGLWLLRHLRRPRAARGVEPRRVGLRDGRGASRCAARPRRRTRARAGTAHASHPTT